MTKRNSRFKFILLAFVAVLGIILSTVSFNIPLTNYKFVGFANSISLGLDLKGGVMAVYEAKTPENGDPSKFESAIDGTINSLTNLLFNSGFSEAQVSREGNNKIRIEVPDVTDSEEIFEKIGEPAELLIRDVKDHTAEPVMRAAHISSVEAGQDNENNWGVAIQFTYEGGVKFADLTGRVNKLYFYLGDAEDPFSEPEVSKQITGGSTFISGGMTQKTAEAYALNIISGTFSLNLTLLENSTVSATLGKDALLWSIIAGAIGLFIIMVIMVLLYRDLGFLSNFSLIFYLILILFFLQALPIVQLTLPGIAGIILSLGMAIDGNIIIFERIKDEYSKGKKLPAAVNAGFKKSQGAILDSNITTVIVAVILYFFGTGSIKGFALTLLLGTIVSVFSTLVITKYLVKLYLPLNSTKANRLNLRREKEINELG